MIKQLTIYNLQFTNIIIGLFYILLLTLHIPAVSAQMIPCQQDSTNPRAGGLISAVKPLLAPNRFGNSINSKGVCVIGNEALFNPTLIDTYAGLKSTFYTQPAAIDTSGKYPPPTTSLPSLNDATRKVYSIINDVSSGSLPYSGVKVVFIDGSLTINQSITNNNFDQGLVFVVRDNIIIDPTVTRIDAFLVSAGVIYTAANTSTGNVCGTSTIVASALTVNGGLISLNPTSPTGEPNPIKFCRKISGPNPPAVEVINHKPKYLVILQDVFSETKRAVTEGTF